MIKLILTFFIFASFLTSLRAVELNVLAEDWAPFNYRDNGKIVGISTDLVVETLKKAGFAYHLQLKPWKRAYLETLREKNTLLYTTSRTEPREDLFKWVGPLFPRQISIYKLKNRTDILIKTLEDVKKYPIGIIRGGSVEEYLTAHGFKNKTHFWTATKSEHNMKKLFKGRIDLITGGTISMPFRVKRDGFDFSELEEVFVLIDQGGYYLAVNKTTADHIVKQLQAAFDGLIQSGLREKIIEKYLGS